LLCAAWTCARPCLPHAHAFPLLFAQRLIIEAACPPRAFRRPGPYRQAAFGAQIAWRIALQITGASVLRRINSSKAAVSDSPHGSCGNVGRRLLLLGLTLESFGKTAGSSVGANYGYAEPQDCSLSVLDVLFGAQFLHDIQWPEPIGEHVLARSPSAGETPLSGRSSRRNRPDEAPRRRRSWILPAGDNRRAASRPRENQHRRGWLFARPRVRRAVSLIDLSHGGMQ